MKINTNEVDGIASVCKFCVHHKVIPQFKEVCSKMGIEEYHRACNHYTFNWKEITPEIGAKAELLATIPTNQLMLLADFIRAEKITRGKGFRFLAPVYVHLIGEKYLSNYAKAWVITAARKYVYVQGKNGAFCGAFLKTSIMKEDKFADVCAKLILEKKIIDPKYRSYFTKAPPKIKSISDIPTIDDAKPPAPKKKFSLNYSLE
jgi:hypothetical protein